MLPLFCLGQGLINNGAQIIITTSAQITIKNGGFTNQTNGTYGVVDNDGIISLTGDFKNNTLTNVNAHVFKNLDSEGEVVFAGTNQEISNTNNFINFEKVTVNASSITNLKAGSAATVNNILNVTGNFVLKSPANENPTGSLITLTGVNDVTGGGNIIVERFLALNKRWQYFSVPLANQSSNLLPGTATANLYTYDESHNETNDPANTNYSNYIKGNGFDFYKAWQSVGSAAIFNTANGSKTGYATYSTSNFNAVFTATAPNLNHSNAYTPLVTYSFNDGSKPGVGNYYDGWNLVGNPYPCAIDWNVIVAQDPSKFKNISNTVYSWDGDNGNYIYYWANSNDAYNTNGQILNSNSRYIAAMQSFFVKATSASPVFSIPKEARLHSSFAMYKNENQETPNFNYIKLKIEYQDFYDEILVRFIDEATVNFDNKFDAYKMYSQTDILPQISSVLKRYNVEIPLAINTLPVSSIENTIIPLGVFAKEDGTYKINVSELNYLENGEIFLVDRKREEEEIWTDLKAVSEYSCFITKGENANRFFLFFAPEGTLPFDENTTKNDVEIYSDFEKIYVNIISGKVFDNEILIYDILGKVIYQSNINNTSEVIQLDIPVGSYIVKFKMNNNIFVKKVILL